MNKDVTVIITAFNEERHLASCLNSIQRQDYKPLEIIVVDDGSTDQTKEIIKNYPKIKTYCLNHQGTALARNFGVKKSRGEVIIFVDADMEFARNFVTQLTKPINENISKGTFSKLEYVANWDNPLARCWNRNNVPPLPDRLRVPQDTDEGEDFRAILKSEFLKVDGFDNIGYTDTWTLANKLGYKPSNAPNAIYYHHNPSTYKEIFESAQWIGKRVYKMGRLGSIIAIIRSFFIFSIIKGIYRGLKYGETFFISFQIIYDFGLTIGALKKILLNNVIK